MARPAVGPIPGRESVRAPESGRGDGLGGRVLPLGAVAGVTCISKEAAQLKNVCQVCLYDLEYNLPAAVVAKAKNQEGALAVPASDVGREFFFEGMATGTTNHPAIAAAAAPADPLAAAELQRLARNTQPYYRRNKPKLCSFWLAKNCTRCADGHCQYRPCNGDFDFLEFNAEQNAEMRAILESDGVAVAMKRTDETMERRRAALHRSRPTCMTW